MVSPAFCLCYGLGTFGILDPPPQIGVETTMFQPGHSRAFTLTELLITVAVVGILAAIAAPFVTGYISTSHQGVMKNNVESIRLFEKNYQAEHRAYVSGTYDPADPGAADGLKSRLGWEPRTEKNTITYVVHCQTDTTDTTDPECTRTSGYYVNATDSEDSTTICVAFEGASCP